MILWAPLIDMRCVAIFLAVQLLCCFIVIKAKPHEFLFPDKNGIKIDLVEEKPIFSNESSFRGAVQVFFGCLRNEFFCLPT